MNYRRLEHTAKNRFFYSSQPSKTKNVSRNYSADILYKFIKTSIY